MGDVASRFQQVSERIHEAAEKSGREPGTVKLIVVSKGQPIDRIREAYLSGARRFGENYAELAVDKISSMAAFTDIEWHMIGHVQSRKAQLICQHFDWMQSLDSVKLAKRLEMFAASLNRSLPVLIECNVSGESSKSGFPAWDIRAWSRLIEPLQTIINLHHLQVKGLMTVPPITHDLDDARSYFRRLYELRAYLTDRLSPVNWPELSMGMSADFEAAILEGATMVRIGEAILGPRRL